MKSATVDQDPQMAHNEEGLITEEQQSLGDEV
jgi:hypothetical protein